MRTLLLGTDFMYNFNGNLIPIEINTNLGMEANIIEDLDDVFNLSGLSSFIDFNNFTKLTYIGGLTLLSAKLRELCNIHKIEFDNYDVYNKITIPDVEDSIDHLIIRSAYDISAIVDEEYCKNKVNFLNLIKNKVFGSQFAYLNDDNILINNITEIIDNGNHPNFILKSIYPDYDKKVYPKLFRVSNQEELNIVLQNVSTNYYLTSFYYNPDKLWNSHIQVFRSFNLIFPPELKSISIGGHTKLTTRNIDDFSMYNPTTFELSIDDKGKYITGDGGIGKPKLLDDDKVEMADGTFKTGLELQVGDIVKTINIPNLYYVNQSNPTANFRITYDEFISGTTYSENKVLAKYRVDKIVDYVELAFTDNTTWEDTKNSSYLILRNDEVRFVYLNVDNLLNGIKIGDQIILIDSTNTVVNTVLKEVSNIVTTKQIFGGWEITVEEEHLFLTQTVDNTSFVAIEHNIDCAGYNCTTGSPCTKGGDIYCNFGVCSSTCVECMDWTFEASVDTSTITYTTCTESQTTGFAGPYNTYEGGSVCAIGAPSWFEGAGSIDGPYTNCLY